MVLRFKLVEPPFQAHQFLFQARLFHTDQLIDCRIYCAALIAIAV